MEALRQWLGQMVCFLCLMQVLLHVIPDGGLKKYVHFFLGILFLMIVLEPVENLFGKESFLENFQIESLRGLEQDLQTGEIGLGDVLPQWNEEAYQRELRGRIEKIYQTYHIPQEDLHTNNQETEVPNGENGNIVDMEKGEKRSAADRSSGWNPAVGDRDSPQ